MIHRTRDGLRRARTRPAWSTVRPLVQRSRCYPPLRLGCARPAAGEDPFYKGKTISLIIGSNASGGYDGYGRLLARHMGKHIPAIPAFVVQNMPGANGVRAASHLYSVAPKDGTVIGIFDQAMFLRQLLGAPGVKGDVAKFNWVGRLVSNSAVLFAWHTAKVKKIEDVFTHELIVAASGAASRLNWAALNTLAGTKFRHGHRLRRPRLRQDRHDARRGRGVEPAVVGAARRESRNGCATSRSTSCCRPATRTPASSTCRAWSISPRPRTTRKLLEIFASPSVVGRAFRDAARDAARARDDPASRVRRRAQGRGVPGGRKKDQFRSRRRCRGPSYRPISPTRPTPPTSLPAPRRSRRRQGTNPTNPWS